MTNDESKSPNTSAPNPSLSPGEYYKRLVAIPIGDVARELLGSKITNESGDTLNCDCPNHHSASKTSLKISLDTGSWYCFGCCVGGGVLHLVEFVQFGACTVGQSGEMPDSHRQARDWLAARIGLEPLGKMGHSAQDVERYETLTRNREACLHALNAFANEFHKILLNDERALTWLKNTYGLQLETIKRLKIGLAYYGEEHTFAMMEKDHDIKRRDAIRTGLFWLNENNSAFPSLQGRITFPYWAGGRIRFLIGRILPWNQTSKGRQEPKYKKLLVHDPKERPYVERCIQNGFFYNQDCLAGRPKELLITEGVTDCIAAMQHGFATISPVTVSFRKDDLPRLAKLLAKVPDVFICLDNELSQVGLNGALKLAKTLEERSIRAQIVSLPLGPEQEKARKTLAAEYGVTEQTDFRKLKDQVTNPTAERLAEVAALVGQAKTDLNAYFAQGRTADDFRKVMAQAKTRVEIMIGRLDTSLNDAQRHDQRKPLMLEIARQPEFMLEKCLKLIQQHYGKPTMTLKALRSELGSAKKTVKTQKHVETQRTALATELAKEKGKTCKAALLELALSCPEGTAPSNFATAEVIFNWFNANGGRFLITPDNKGLFFFRGQMMSMETAVDDSHRPFLATINHNTELTNVSPRGREVIENLRNFAWKRGTLCRQLGWMSTNIHEHTLYFNLSNEQSEIAKISPSNVEIQPNGANDSGVLLYSSEKFKPAHYLPELSIEEGERLYEELVNRFLSCSKNDKMLIKAWIQCFLLIEFTGTQPKTRFEGRHQSGKSTASEMITTLVYGDPQIKLDSDAARYTDAAKNPLIALDNVEVQNASAGMKSFFLTATVETIREKRNPKTSTGTVTERPHCLINTTGIEPLGEELAELQTRMFTIPFSEKHRPDNHVHSKKAISTAIGKHRDSLLTTIIKKTALVLDLIKDGKHETVMRLLSNELGDHVRKRANDFISLMYLMTYCAAPPEQQEAAFAALTPEFKEMLQAHHAATEETSAMGHPIANALRAYFQAYRSALEADSLNGGHYYEAQFITRYFRKPDEPNALVDIQLRDLLPTLRVAARTANDSLPYERTKQFSSRFHFDKAAIEDAGFEISRRKGRNNVNLYTIRQIGEATDLQQRQPPGAYKLVAVQDG